jgi:hypothetical protein
MTKFLAIYFAAMTAYTAWCCAYGPPYRDAYGAIVHAAWQCYAERAEFCRR